jgi:hypothetical protein
VPQDQPARLAQLIATFVAEEVGAAKTASAAP